MNIHNEIFKIVIDEYSKFKEVDCIYCNIKNNNDLLFMIFINNDKYEHELQSNMIDKELDIEDIFEDIHFNFHYIPIKFVNKDHCIDYEKHMLLYERSK